jgi:hypothetical protein
MHAYISFPCSSALSSNSGLIFFYGVAPGDDAQRVLELHLPVYGWPGRPAGFSGLLYMIAVT